MLARREFVSASLLFASGSALAKPGSVFAVATADDIPHPELFIFDQGFAQAQPVANSMVAAGIAQVSLAGDFTTQWSTQLQPLWKQRPLTVAGLTTERTLFILQTLAADHRMKLLHSVQIEQQAGTEPLYQWLLVPRSAAQRG